MHEWTPLSIHTLTTKRADRHTHKHIIHSDTNCCLNVYLTTHSYSRGLASDKAHMHACIVYTMVNEWASKTGVLITFCEPVIHIIVFVFCMKAKVSVLFSDNDILDIQHTGMWEPDLKCIVYIIDRYIIWTRVSCRPMQRALLRFSYTAQDVGRQFERPIKFRQNEVVLRLFDPNKHS